MNFYVDKRLVHRDSLAPYEDTWHVSRLAYGTHVVTAKAYDSAGQLDADAVAVKRVRQTARASAKRHSRR